MKQAQRWDNVKVGALVLVALGILIAGSLWMAGSSLGGVRRVPYTVLLEDSAGLQAGDRVRFAGVSIGRIQDVSLVPGDPWPVRFDVSVRQSIPVRTDSKAQIRSSGLLGTNFLELGPGSDAAELLPPGGEIYGEMSPGMEQAMAKLGELSDRVIGLIDQTSGILDQVSAEIEPITERLQMLLSDENVDNISGLLAGLRTTADDSGPRLRSLLTRLDSVAAQLEGGLDGLPELQAQIGGLLDSLQSSIGVEGERIRRLLEQAEASLVSADGAMAVVSDNRPELEAAMRDLRDTVSNLKAFSQQVKERPYSLIRIRAEPERLPGDGVSNKKGNK